MNAFHKSKILKKEKEKVIKYIVIKTRVATKNKILRFD